MVSIDVTRRIERLPDGRQTLSLPKFAVEVQSGPNAGARATSDEGRLTIGTDAAATLVVRDPTVSRFHVELEATDEGIAVRDLGSTNGTRIGAVRIRDAIVDESTELTIGQTRIRLELGGERCRASLSDATRFGGLMGSSPAMRALYITLERAAPTNAPILVTGESGTGKELTAHAIHAASPRRDQPFEIVDCGGLPSTLIESELFGHEKGAFTGAAREREGAFERAEGGTLFIDELGELPLELQPKLLRALGEHEVRRIGARAPRKVDVRIVAATHRDLRCEVNAGRFRADLYYRLAVIQVKMPALRERPDDIPLLARVLLDRIGVERGVRVADLELPSELWQHLWPGNVRELRNYLEHLAILRSPPALEARSEAQSASSGVGSILEGLDTLPFPTARGVLVERFEQRYLARLLEQTGGNVAEASRRSGVSRATLFRRLRHFDAGS